MMYADEDAPVLSSIYAVGDSVTFLMDDEEKQGEVVDLFTLGASPRVNVLIWTGSGFCHRFEDEVTMQR